MSYNTATRNSNGLWISQQSTGTHAFANRSAQNTGDGIRVTSTSARLTANSAYQNGALGIDAAAGVVDGGGNRAAQNGDPAQCTPNIACS